MHFYFIHQIEIFIENLKQIFRFSKQINKRQKVDDELAKKFCDNKLKKKKSKLHLQLIDRSLQFVKYANANATETKKIDFRKVAAQFIILLFTWSIPGIFFVCFRSFSKNNTIVHNYPVRIQFWDSNACLVWVFLKNNVAVKNYPSSVQCCKNCNDVCLKKTENKRKRGRG